MKVIMRLALVGLALTLGTTSARAELVLNGSFENNSAGGTQFNLANSSYTALMNNSTGFGNAQEIDIMQGAPYGTAPVHGSYKLGIHRQGGAGTGDAFSLNLSSSVVAGKTYTLSFSAQGVTTFDPNIGAVEVGLSSSATTFGSLVFSGTPVNATSGWTTFSHTFVAGANANFLTVQNAAQPLQSWLHVDNFSLVEANIVPAPSGVILAGLGVLGAFGLRNRFRKVAAV
jgi:hypothetical protein